MGHVRDLPKSKIGVDVEGGFVPEYELIKGKEKQIRDLRIAARKATSTLLAADPDREGEAIAWHLAEALGLRDPDRIVFHEITKLAVEQRSPIPERSTVARRRPGGPSSHRSAGRVPALTAALAQGQGGTLRGTRAVGCRAPRRRPRPRSTRSSRSSPWTIDALLVKDGSNPFTARLVGRRGDKDTYEHEKLELGTEAEANEVIAALGLDDKGAVTALTPPFVVRSIEVKERSSLPQAPHTTSTLQQDASSRLGMPPKRAMSIAQQLYEGVELGSAGSTGLITYMRTN